MILDAAINLVCASQAEGGLPGWCSVKKARWLVDTILAEKLTNIVEIGVFGGRSLIAMALAVKHLSLGGYVLGVDSYCFEDQIEGEHRKHHIEWARNIDFELMWHVATNAVQKYAVQSVCGVLRASSLQVSWLVETVDLLHIDGCHSVLASCRDVESWLPKVRQGGIVVLDDSDWDTVQPAREMLMEQLELVHTETTWEAYRIL